MPAKCRGSRWSSRWGPEQGGKAMVPGGVPCTLSAACLDVANELAAKPFSGVAKQQVHQETPEATKKPGLIM